MTKTTKESWFDKHVIVIGPDSKFENALKEKLRETLTSEKQSSTQEENTK